MNMSLCIYVKLTEIYIVVLNVLPEILQYVASVGQRAAKVLLTTQTIQ
jgi:hypothetical protein